MDRAVSAPDLAAAIARLAAMPAFVASAIAAFPRALATRPATSDFALVEHACHLRDLDREAFIVRARRMIGEAVPVLEPFQGDVVARERDYLSQDAVRASRDFAAAREALVRFLSALGNAQLEREGMFAGERITVRQLIAMIEEHDAEHRAQIDRLLLQLDAA